MIVTSGAFDASGARFYALPEGAFLRPLEELVRARVIRELSAEGLLYEEHPARGGVERGREDLSDDRKP